jgi:hypothetical protein
MRTSSLYHSNTIIPDIMLLERAVWLFSNSLKRRIICCGCCTYCCSNTIIPGTMLPPNLQVLHARDCPHAAPLLQLQHLSKLELRVATTSAEELIHLAGLTSLKSVALKYAWEWQMVAAAEGFGQLRALKSLDIGDISGCSDAGLPTDQVLRYLSGATQLTRLVIVSPDLDFEGITPRQLADVIRGMTQLQTLVLRHVKLRKQQQQQQQPEVIAAGPAAAAEGLGDTEVLAAVLSALPQLQRLVQWDCSVKESQLSGSGAAAAAAAKGWHELEHWIDEY